MNADRPLAALRVPTLTEVVTVAEPSADAADAAAAPAREPDAARPTAAPVSVDLHLDDVDTATLPVELESAPATLSAAAPFPAALPATPPARPTALPTDTQLIQQVLADVSRQVELMLEYRMRETLAPILARATDTMIRDTRNQLVNTLHEMVARAVAQEMARHRDR